MFLLVCISFVLSAAALALVAVVAAWALKL
jgi:hypothetical protein